MAPIAFLGFSIMMKGIKECCYRLGVAMFYELIRTAVQKILQDKILLGLVVVGILGIFVGGVTMGDSKDDDKKDKAPVEATAQKASAPAAAPTAAAAAPVEPTVAADFIGWWLGTAMDYNNATAANSHNQAMSWMTVDAAKGYAAQFWNPQIVNAVQTNKLVAAFQPVAVQAQAINPDGSVVVGVTGNMVVQSNGQPVVQQFAGSFLVRKEQDGLRVAGLETRSTPPGTSIF